MFVKKTRKSKLLVCLLFLPLSSFSQIRHIQATKMAGMYYEWAASTNAVGASYCYYLKDNISVKNNLAYTWVHFELSKYRMIEDLLECPYTLASNHKNLFFNGKGGIMGGLEFTSNQILSRSDHKLFAGECIGLSLEVFLSSKVKLEIEADQRFYQGSLVAKNRYFLRLGTYLTL